MGVMHRLADGTFEIRENFDIKPFGTEDDRARFILAMTEAAGEGKSTKLEAKIAAMPVGITRNKTFYPAYELEASIPSWTVPYPCPVIKDHNEYEVDGIVGRIQEAYVAKDGATDALWFNVSILDEEAQKKVADGTWAQVSIGTRVESAKCSICGTDLAIDPWCGHERGEFYRKNEDDPNSPKELCYLIMGKISGREVSFVTTPSAASAGVRDTNVVTASEAEVTEPRHFDGMILAWANESDTESLRMVEAYHNGSPASNGEATVPSIKKEESVEKPEVIETEVIPAVEADLSDATIEGEETTEVAEVVVEADGLAPVTEVAEEVAPEEVVEAPAEITPESTEEVATDPAASDTVEDVEPAPVAEEPVEEEVVEEPTERDELLSRIATLEANVLSLKAQVYVESGLRDGILAGERDALVELHASMTESSLDELIDVVAARRTRVSTSEEIMKNKVKSPVLKINDDDKADEHNSDDIIVSVKTKEGSHAVTVTEDRTKVVISPKFNQ